MRIFAFGLAEFTHYSSVCLHLFIQIQIKRTCDKTADRMPNEWNAFRQETECPEILCQANRNQTRKPIIVYIERPNDCTCMTFMFRWGAFIYYYVKLNTQLENIANLTNKTTY